MASGLNKMRLAKPHPSIDVKRVVGFAGTIRDSLRGGMSKSITRRDNETAEGIFLV